MSAGVYATTAKRHRKGEPRRFVNGHNWRGKSRRERIDENYYSIEDRGYETPCWIWTRTINRKGYGTCWDKVEKRLRVAHQVVYEQEIGPFPKDLQSDHLCRQRACVNPDHIEPVTQFVNQQRGANAKLTRAQADEIRHRRQTGESLLVLSVEFGVSKSVVSGIARGHFWP